MKGSRNFLTSAVVSQRRCLRVYMCNVKYVFKHKPDKLYCPVCGYILPRAHESVTERISIHYRVIPMIRTADSAA